MFILVKIVKYNMMNVPVRNNNINMTIYIIQYRVTYKLIPSNINNTTEDNIKMYFITSFI